MSTMRNSFTAVIEKSSTFTEAFETEPYEAAWAGEARWFIRVLDIAKGCELAAYPQISPDGIFWCDLETSQPIRLSQTEVGSVGIGNFGGWLRLRGELTGDAPHVKVLIYLALKA